MPDAFRLVRRIMLATNKIDGVYYLFAKQHRANENTLAFLYALIDGEPHSQKEISDAWIIPRTTINSIVKTMLAEGYVAFSPEPRGKEKTLVLTPKGLAYADALFDDIYTAEERAITATLAHYPPEFVTALEDFSDRLLAEYEKASAPKETTRSKE